MKTMYAGQWRRAACIDGGAVVTYIMERLTLVTSGNNGATDSLKNVWVLPESTNIMMSWPEILPRKRNVVEDWTPVTTYSERATNKCGLWTDWGEEHSRSSEAM